MNIQSYPDGPAIKLVLKRDSGISGFFLCSFPLSYLQNQNIQNYYQNPLRWEQFIKEIDHLLPEISEFLANWPKFLFHCCSIPLILYLIRVRLRTDYVAMSLLWVLYSPKNQFFYSASLKLPWAIVRNNISISLLFISTSWI